MFKYEIGGKVYIQKPLVLGQIGQLLDCLKGTAITSFNPLDIFNELRDQMPGLLSIVLTEEGKSPGDKDLEKMAGEMEFSIDIDTALGVIEDFFDCNPVASIWKRLNGMPQKIVRRLPVGLKSSSSSSPEETSQSEMKSSGDILPENANPSPDTF